MKDLQYLTVLAGSGSKVLTWRSRPVTDVSINQAINLFVQKCNRPWTGHQGRMQHPLTGARKNKVRATNDNT